MEKKIKEAISLLLELDAMANNEICLREPHEKDISYSFFGLAMILDDYLHRDEMEE